MGQELTTEAHLSATDEVDGTHAPVDCDTETTVAGTQHPKAPVTEEYAATLLSIQPQQPADASIPSKTSNSSTPRHRQHSSPCASRSATPSATPSAKRRPPPRSSSYQSVVHSRDSSILADLLRLRAAADLSHYRVALALMQIGSVVSPRAWMEFLRDTWHTMALNRHSFPEPSFTLIKKEIFEDDEGEYVIFFTPLYTTTPSSRVPRGSFASDGEVVARESLSKNFNPSIPPVLHDSTVHIPAWKSVWLNLMKRPWSGKAIRKVSTSQIGGPSNFRHLVHMTSDLLNDFRPEVDDQLLSDQKIYRIEGSAFTVDKVMQIWEREIIPNWEQKRKAKATVKLWRLGIPHPLRAVVWKLAIGNMLHITPELFEIFRAHARSAANRLTENERRNRTMSALSDEGILESIDCTPLTKDILHTISCTTESSETTENTRLRMTEDDSYDMSALATPQSISRRGSQASFTSHSSIPIPPPTCTPFSKLSIDKEVSETALTPPSSPELQKSSIPVSRPFLSQSRNRVLSSRAILGHEHSVALIPIDLPRTVSIRNTEEDINPRSRANSVCASPAFVKGHGRQASRTKNAIDDDPKQLALQQAEYERRKIAEMDDITTPLGRMRAVLEAYVCYRPDVGYVQGMSYLASMLVGTGKEMGVYDMFSCLANMLHQPCLRTFYSMNLDAIQPYILVHTQLMAEYLPALHQHFRNIDFAPEMYLYEWVLTLFSQILPTHVSYRIWDCYFLYGDTFIFCTTIGILHSLLPHLLDRPFEDVATMLTRGMDTIAPLIDEEMLFENVNAIRLSTQRFNDLLKTCERQCARMRERGG